MVIIAALGLTANHGEIIAVIGDPQTKLFFWPMIEQPISRHNRSSVPLAAYKLIATKFDSYGMGIFVTQMSWLINNAKTRTRWFVSDIAIYKVVFSSNNQLNQKTQ